MPTYSYLPLRNRDSIRLVWLARAPNEHPHIHCKITRHRLSDDSLKYEAISYTWGDPGDRVTLLCGGHDAELSVTRNCYNALLRDAEAARTIWIDAVCINQHDVSERSAQVRVMHEIFAAASRVVAYLGEETPGSQLLFHELALVDRLYRAQVDVGERPKPSTELVQELDLLIARPWCSRIWTVPEMHVAEEVMLMCGRRQASITAVVDCMYGYGDTLVTWQLMPVPIRAAYGLLAEYNGPDTAQNLWRMLADTRDCMATDPRDRVFALKALVSENREALSEFIDYRRSVESIFESVTLFLLPRVKLLVLLAQRQPHKLKMPSWIPDWSETSRTHRKWYLGSIPDEESETAPTVDTVECSCAKCTGQHRVLRVQGTQYPCIVSLGPIFNFEIAAKACLEAIQHILDPGFPGYVPEGVATCANPYCHGLPPDLIKGELSTNFSLNLRQLVLLTTTSTALRGLGKADRAWIVNDGQSGPVSIKPATEPYVSNRFGIDSSQA
ncbi:hypothetical protein H2200_003041 [Cladophialophora chaetospira]|uniref:Heterokaryon incompatibility domain-containing protein n=1 Tax=Cladophialophora chaetospira TaxID=386627 RepID=A0AA39CLW9_9EURO|nr:hypothetical protein H2200_003041 [Cladophialophora chaetospira]